MIKSSVGLEAEYILQDKEGKTVLIPDYLDRDDFPLLGEIRADPGESAWETIGNFYKQHAYILDKISRNYKDYKVLTPLIQKVDLKAYQQAIRAAREGKKFNNKLHNIYGTDINEFSDQVIKNKKIQGVNISCGLHVHFSCSDIDSRTIEEHQYQPVNIPLSAGEGIKTSIQLYSSKGYEKKKEIKCVANQLNRPAIEWIVKEMDKTFFDRFVPSKKEERTKYRHPGYYELKEYGFEYRSLPFNDKVLASIAEIVQKAFELMDNLNVW